MLRFILITKQQKWLLINGIINVLSTNLNYAKDDIVIVISHKTSIMRIQYIEAFEVYNEDELNANSVIDRFLIKNNFTTLYDYKIPLSKKSKIDSKLYASENQLAYDYLTQNNLTAAENLLLQALALDPDYETALMNMAQLYFMKQDFPSAKKYLQRVLEVNPQNEKAKIALSKI
mgnify:CR=1 FL=1